MTIYPVCCIGDGTLAIMPRPPGDAELTAACQSLKEQGIEKLVSLLAPSESQTLGLTEQSAVCATQGLIFENFAIADYQVPESMDDFDRFIHMLLRDLRAGINTVVHCRAGIGRSGLVAIAVLLNQQTELSEAIKQVASARGENVPETAVQQQWLQTYEHSLVGQSGDFE